MSNLGFRVLERKSNIDKNIVRAYKDVVTPHISDNLNRLFAGGSKLRPYHKEGKLLGVAITVRTRPGDNLMIHKALDMAEPGDVLVVDAGGDKTNAVFGEVMLRLALKKGITGVVINGAIRDVNAFSQSSFPIYACGVTHRGPYKDGPGEINVPIQLDGMVVNPGDLVVGDEDGIVTIPNQIVEEVLEKANKQAALEVEIIKSIEEGTIDRSWIDKTLEEKGCEF